MGPDETPLPLNQALLRADSYLLPLPVRHERGEGWGEGFPSWANNPPLPGPLLPWWEERETSAPHVGALIQQQRDQGGVGWIRSVLKGVQARRLPYVVRYRRRRVCP